MKSLIPLLLIGFIASARAEDRMDFAIEAGAFDRHESVALLPLQAEIRSWKTFALRDVEADRDVPCQVVASDALAFFVHDLQANARRRYRLTPGAPKAQPENACTCEDNGKRLTLTVNRRPVLRYNHATIEPPSDLDPIYRRSGYIHPLFTPWGKEVTGDFARDHAHQHAIFFAWVNTTFNGRKTDFWNQPGRIGQVRHVEVLKTESGPVFAGFSARLRHEALTPKGDAEPALDETWTVRAYRAEPGANHFVIDFESRQTCAGTKPLQINKYHYGGFGIRANNSWLDPEAKGDEPPVPSRGNDSEFLTSEGKHRPDGNHTRPRWVDLSGKLDGAVAGVSVLDDPRNFRFPQPVRLHPNKPYFCFAPMVEGEFRLEPGRTYVSRYRLITHDGPPVARMIDDLWRDMAEPVAVKDIAR